MCSGQGLELTEFAMYKFDRNHAPELTWRTHTKSSLSWYYIVFSVTSLEDNSHEQEPQVGGFRCELAHCCLPAGRKRADGDKPEAERLLIRPAHMVTACLQDALVILFSVICGSLLTSLFTSLWTASPIALCLFMANCCQTVVDQAGLFPVSCAWWGQRWTWKWFQRVWHATFLHVKCCCASTFEGFYRCSIHCHKMSQEHQHLGPNQRHNSGL